MKNYFVYIMASPSRRTYIGITSDVERRVWEHKHKIRDGFSRRYNIVLLVYVEQYGNPQNASAREKELKDWRRERKVALIEAKNPQWLDLSADW